MKYILAFAIMVSLGHASSAQSPVMHPFTLEGQIRGRDTGYVYLNYRPAGQMGTTDSCGLVKGHFLFKGSIAEPTRAGLSTWNFFDPSSHRDDPNVIDFRIEPTHMKFSAVIGHFQNMNLTGSVSNEEYNRLIKVLSPASEAADEAKRNYLVLNMQYGDAKKAGSDSLRLAGLKQRVDSLKNLADLLHEKEVFIDSVFIMQNPDSYIAAERLGDAVGEGIRFPSLEWAYSRLSKRMQGSIPGQNVKYQIDMQKVISLGAPARNFIAVDQKNDTINLADYEGKRYVLLDFGTSWCGPCRELTPSLKDLYHKYDTAIEIISIAKQDQEDDWRKMVKDEHLPWPQILENARHVAIEPTGNSITDSYYVVTIPTLILIDRKSQAIIGMFGGGSGMPAYSVVDEFKKMFENN